MMERPFKRRTIAHCQLIIWCGLGLALLGYSYIYHRQFSEICFPITLGLGLFILLKALLVLKELLVQGNNFDFPLTLSLVTHPSNTSGEDQSECVFWIKLFFFVIGATPLPSLETWFENKVDIFLCLFIIAIGIHFQWYDCALLESYRLEKPFSYSGGSAMAFSFYYGYLKLIAPGLLHRMNVFQGEGNITDEQIPQKKLFVLIPSSSFVFDKLEGYQKQTKTKDLIIEHVGEKLDCHQQDRSLVKGRTYKNTMYIVEYSSNEIYYVLLEGATPLKTFYETCREHNEFEKNRREVVSSFYYTLKKLIRENKEMKDIVKLIYYDDEKKDITIPVIVKERILKKVHKKKKN